MGSELTWIAIAASLAMGLAGVCLFVFAVKKDYFRDLEDVKYQVFWSELEESIDVARDAILEDNDRVTSGDPIEALQR